ncbi:small G-protein Ras2 [Linnemannia elongata]|nr:small G-protein Ras2 [Linnemannia elongata]KAH7030424.1 small G-protein Ras2 [Linnemannia elongata]
MMVYKLVVLGDRGVGKTALITQLILNYFETYDYVIEDSYRKAVVIDDQCCVLDILDMSSQEENTAFRDMYIRDGEGFLLVYSITARSTFDTIRRFYDKIVRVKDSEKVPMILVGNKSDKSAEREVTHDEGALMAASLNCGFVETSAKDALNVEQSFYNVVRMIRQARDAEGPRQPRRRRRRVCAIL